MSAQVRAGLVGGLGPESTIDYYRRILDRWASIRPGSAPPLVIDSLDVQQAIRDQGNPGVGPTKFVAATAAPNGDLHLFVLDQADGLWHTIRASNGDWPYPWGDVQQAIRDHGNPDVGPTRFVSASADLNGDVHVFVLDQANELWHTIRRASGDWPYPWGNVETVLPAAVMA